MAKANSIRPSARQNAMRQHKCDSNKDHKLKQIVKVTSIEEVFYLEILIIKLCGGFLFDWHNRLLAIAYKVIALVVERQVWTVIFNTQEADRAFVILFDSFARSHWKVDKAIENAWLLICNCILIFSSVAEIYHFNTLNIVLKKRLDERYLKLSQENVRFVKRMFYLWIVFGLALPQGLYLESVKFGAFCINNPASNCTLRAYLGRGDDLVIASSPVPIISQLLRLLVDITGEILHDIWMTGFFLGTFFVYLMVFGVINDVLTEVSRSDGSKTTRKSRQSTRVPTTELLVHVRDILLALRHTMGSHYASTLILLLGLMSLVPSYALIYSANNHMLTCSLLIIWCIPFLALIISAISVTNRLHEAADEIAARSQLQLVDKSSRSYAESQTIVKLADEISSIWPTDWFEPSIKWALSGCSSLFVFVVSVHQVAERKFKRES